MVEQLIEMLLEAVFLDVIGPRAVSYPLNLGMEARLAKAGLRLERTQAGIVVLDARDDTQLVTITRADYGEYSSLVVTPAALVMRALALAGQTIELNKGDVERYEHGKLLSL